MISLAFLLFASQTSAVDAGTATNGKRNEVLRSYHLIDASSACLEDDLRQRYAAALAAMRKLMTAYYEVGSKRSSWSPPPMFVSQTFPCSDANAQVSQFEAQVKDFELALAKEQ